MQVRAQVRFAYSPNSPKSRRAGARSPGPREEARSLARILGEIPRPQRFDLQIAYDKTQRRVELTATVSEAVADAFENAKALQAEGSSVVVRDIAGARIVSRYHPRIIQRTRLPGI